MAAARAEAKRADHANKENLQGVVRLCAGTCWRVEELADQRPAAWLWLVSPCALQRRKQSRTGNGQLAGNDLQSLSRASHAEGRGAILEPQASTLAKDRANGGGAMKKLTLAEEKAVTKAIRFARAHGLQGELILRRGSECSDAASAN